jgi:AcrR family transcriptional regulator
VTRTRRTRSDALANRKRVLEVASEVFATQGLSATLADVAAAAGVGVGTLYRGFENKDELIYVVYEPRLRDAELTARQFAESEDAWTGLVRFLETSADNLATDMGLRQFVLGRHTDTLGWSRTPPSRKLFELLEQTDTRVLEQLTGLVDRAKQAGQLRQDFEVSDILLASAAIQSAADFGGTSHPRLYRRLIGMLIDGFRTSRSEPTPLSEAAVPGDRILPSTAVPDEAAPHPG